MSWQERLASLLSWALGKLARPEELDPCFLVDSARLVLAADRLHSLGARAGARLGAP